MKKRLGTHRIQHVAMAGMAKRPFGFQTICGGSQHAAMLPC
jgi:hypothetical protein